MKRYVLIPMSLSLAVSMSLAGDPGPETPPVPATPAPDVPAAPAVTVKWDGPALVVYAAAEWRLCVQYLRKGTRSEGQDGLLYRGADVVTGQAIGDTTNTPLGELKWYGTQRKNLWDNTGWNFADKKLIKPSQLVPVTEAAAATPVAPTKP